MPHLIDDVSSFFVLVHVDRSNGIQQRLYLRRLRQGETHGGDIEDITQTLRSRAMTAIDAPVLWAYIAHRPGAANLHRQRCAMLLRCSPGVLAYMLLCSSAIAQDRDAPPRQATDEDLAETAHEYHRNVVAFFTGLTHEGPRDNGVALGIEYERRINATFGIGALAEHTFGDIDAWVYAFPLAYHTGPWKLYVAPGVEDGEHGSESLWRLGGEYGFEVGTWEIAPQIDVDLLDQE
jgi:hypothetical protein